jgi:hypothetical protein
MTMEFNVAKAKEALKKSHFDVSKPIEIVARNSERPRLITQYIQNELKKLSPEDMAQKQLKDKNIFWQS